jgi:hypothetical protein
MALSTDSAGSGASLPPPPPPPRGRQVTQAEALALGGAALAAGVVFGGATHYTATTKQLKEEGVELAARRRALPLAARALAGSALGAAALAAAAFAAWRAAGGEAAEAAQLSSWDAAVALARRQREAVQRQFRGAALGSEAGGGAAGAAPPER